MRSATAITHLASRGVIEITGEDHAAFLQGLVTNDIAALQPGAVAYAALLTPQGKYLFDFLVVAQDGGFLLDVEGARRTDLIRKLSLYKLRAKVAIADRTDTLAVYWTTAATPAPTDVIPYADPRHPDMGTRMMAAADLMAAGGEAAYQAHRLKLGIPEGSADFPVDKLLILEGNLDYLNGVSFTKGCYVGQELTARMKHRGKVRKRLLPVTVLGDLPPAGTPVSEDGKEIGELRSGLDSRAIAYLRLDDIHFNKPYTCGNAMVRPERPTWLPEAALRPGKEE